MAWFMARLEASLTGIEAEIPVIIALFVGSGLSLLSAGIIGLVHLRDQSRRLQIILVGQLSNLSSHCWASEQLLWKEDRELILRLRLSRYGEISSLNEALTKVGHLDATTIQKLIELSLRVRNNDLVIERGLERLAAGDDEIDLRDIGNRLTHVNISSAALAAEIKVLRLPLWWSIHRSV